MNLGLTEMIFLFVLGLLLFGPKKLPEIGRQLGKLMAEFKRASNEFQAQLHDEVRKLDEEAAEKSGPHILPPAGATSRGELPRDVEGQSSPTTDDHDVNQRQNG